MVSCVFLPFTSIKAAASSLPPVRTCAQTAIVGTQDAHVARFLLAAVDEDGRADSSEAETLDRLELPFFGRMASRFVDSE